MDTYQSCDAPRLEAERKTKEGREQAIADIKAKKCGNCSHFKLIGKSKDSWGVCSWMETQTPPMPVWVRMRNKGSGALNPEQRHCPVHEHVFSALTTQGQELRMGYE